MHITISCLPFGTGQFYHGKVKLGLLLFGLEAAGLGISYYSNYRRWVEQDQFDQNSLEKESAANKWYNSFLVSFPITSLIYAGGVFESLWNGGGD
ncbi:MAG: hypothetical protein ABIA63_05030 [bacterium]